FELTTRNVGGHSSRPRIDNAIYDLADAIKKLQSFRFPVRHSEVTRSYMRQNAELYEGDVAAAMLSFADNPANKKAADVLFAQPSLVGRTRTTCIPTVLSGGHANNAQPRSAKVVVNCRVFPGVSFAEVEEVLTDLIDNPKLEVKVLDNPESSPASELNPVVMAAVTKVVRRRLGDIPIIPTMEPGATDGVFTRAAGIPTFAVAGYVYDPDDDRAHGKDESNPVESFYGELDHWYELVKELSDK
ncbi:MAG: carboxypeptidase PM20D1, partial [Halieaceae bacterium]